MAVTGADLVIYVQDRVKDEGTPYLTKILRAINTAHREACGKYNFPQLASIDTAESHLATIEGVTLTDGAVVSIDAADHGLATGDMVLVRGIVGTTQLNSRVFVITVVDTNTFTLNNTKYKAGEANYSAYVSATVSGISLAGDLVRITATAHGLATSDRATFADVVGTTELNGNTYTVTVIDDNAFDLNDTDPANFTAWASGGVAYTGLFSKPYIDLPSDYHYGLDGSRRKGKVYSETQRYNIPVYDSAQEFDRRYPYLDESGNVTAMVVKGDKLWAQPIPDSVEYFRRHYQRLPADIANDAAEPEAVPDHLREGVIGARAVGNLHLWDGELNLAAPWLSLAETNFQAMLDFLGPEDEDQETMADDNDYITGG